MNNGQLAMLTRLSAVVALLACALCVARPQSKSTPTTAHESAPEKKSENVWTIDYDSMEHNDKSGEGHAEKVVAVSDQGTTIHSDRWTWNDKTKTAHATGNLKMTDPQADATSDAADVFYAKGKRLLVLTGNVEILVKPKKDEAAPAAPSNPSPAAPTTPSGPMPVSLQDGKATVQDDKQAGKAGAQEDKQDNDNSAQSARKYPATITCDKVEYEYAKSKKHAVLTGHFKVVQKLPDKTRTLTAEHGEWFGLEEKILLYGPVHWEDTKGMKGDTKGDVPIWTKEGDERLKTGPGVVILPPEEDEGESPGASGTGAKDKATGGKDGKGAASPANPNKNHKG